MLRLGKRPGMREEPVDARLGHPVVDLPSPSPRRDKPAPAEAGEMTAHPSLWSSRDHDEFGDRPFPLDDRLKDAEPCRIAQAPEEFGLDLNLR